MESLEIGDSMLPLTLRSLVRVQLLVGLCWLLWLSFGEMDSASGANVLAAVGSVDEVEPVGETDTRSEVDSTAEEGMAEGMDSVCELDSAAMMCFLGQGVFADQIHSGLRVPNSRPGL